MKQFRNREVPSCLSSTLDRLELVRIYSVLVFLASLHFAHIINFRCPRYNILVVRLLYIGKLLILHSSQWSWRKYPVQVSQLTLEMGVAELHLRGSRLQLRTILRYGRGLHTC